MRRCIRFFFSLLFLPSFLCAQSTSPTPVRVPGDTIVVTADRIVEPLHDATDSVSVITADDLQRSQAVSVAEALRAAIAALRQSGDGRRDQCRDRAP